MNDLIIRLTGQINHSNFDEWKNELIIQIQSVNTELITDNDFAIATRHAKLFKDAERALKQAKQSAIEQAADIQRLFSAIDQISEEARQARLSLERQIKARKLEIKQEFVRSGIDTVQVFIDQQHADFQQIDHSIYLNRHRFELAIKGKAGIRGVQHAIDETCRTIRLEISERGAIVARNGAKIDSISNEYRSLFQDRTALLSLTEQELQLTIDKRIAFFREQNEKARAEKAIQELKRVEYAELNPSLSLPVDAVKATELEKYRLILDIVSSKESAIEIARAIKVIYGNHTAISAIKLTRNRD
ncbi:hypothetical protein QUF58_04755 [Anaerolineales bacterium HSG24]|nr:hypothetical protein [Anaerolineales bacterium HSG24]